MSGTCAECGRPIANESSFTTGYGVRSSDGAHVCYTCCGVDDYARLVDPSRLKDYGYLSGDTFTNWSGSLHADVSIREGQHNMARTRRDFWIKVVDQSGVWHCWHGVQLGDNGDNATLTRVTPKPADRRFFDRVRILET